MASEPIDRERAKIFLAALHHSDLTWQFPYDRYDEIREEQIDIVLGFFERHPQFQFIFDQAYVVKNYLQRNPEKYSVLKELVAAGKIELIGLNCIPDLNLTSGESFIRNSLSGQEYYQKKFDVFTDTASLTDAFGMPAQVPQLLRKLGYRYLLPGRMPNADPLLDQEQPFNWQSPDGSSIPVVPQNAGIDKSSYLFNVPVALNPTERFTQTLENLSHTVGDIFALYCTEVENLDEQFFGLMEEINARDEDGKREITFGRYADYCARVDVPNLPVFSGEFNPTFTGCYTTRIQVKQAIRKAESLIFAAELGAALAGNEPLDSTIWEQLNLAQFHDAACGCHHDAPNVQVMGKLRQVHAGAEATIKSAMEKFSDNGLTVFSPNHCPWMQLISAPKNALPKGLAVQQNGEEYLFGDQLPSYGVKHYSTEKVTTSELTVLTAPQHYQLRTDYYEADFSTPYPKIQSLRQKAQVFGQEHFGEILFRHENGTMWSERLMEMPLGSEWENEKVTCVEEGPLFIKVATQGSCLPERTPRSGNNGNYWHGFESLSFEKEYIFPRHTPYFKLRVKLNFTGCNTKVFLNLPVELNPHHATALYDTPFAAANRKPYFEVPYPYRDTAAALSSSSEYAHAAGDWPALNWVDYSDETAGLAVANTGTPGHQLVGKNIYITLLRSGTDRADGSMYPQQGSLDNGTHLYEFAFADHVPGDENCAALLGEMLNRRPVAAAGQNCSAPQAAKSFVSFTNSHIGVSAVYPQNDVIVVRAYEMFGKAEETQLLCPEVFVLHTAEMNGTPLEKSDTTLTFSPYEIRTFALVPAPAK